MNKHGIRPLAFALALLATLVLSSQVAADDASKEACLESHGRGQDARDQGKLSLARKLFMTCAQAMCPPLVQNDCARFADNLERSQPWLSFAARDSAGNDLPDTAVYVDDVLLVTRLDDGKPHEVDPGKHVVRFSYGGREQLVTVVVGSGEKGRTVVGTFETESSTAQQSGPAASPVQTTHDFGAKAVMVAGGTLLLTGSILGLVATLRFPAACSAATHECAAPPGSASFGEAAKAARLGNAAFALGGVGLAALGAGLVWYFKSAKTEGEVTTLRAWGDPHSVGLSLGGRL